MHGSGGALGFDVEGRRLCGSLWLCFSRRRRFCCWLPCISCTVLCQVLEQPAQRATSGPGLV